MTATVRGLCGRLRRRCALEAFARLRYPCRVSPKVHRPFCSEIIRVRSRLRDATLAPFRRKRPGEVDQCTLAGVVGHALNPRRNSAQPCDRGDVDDPTRLLEIILARAIAWLNKKAHHSLVPHELQPRRLASNA